jgi:hypothetical protein
MFKSKKAVEQTRVIVYVIFTTILTLAGIYIAYIYMGNIDIDIKYSDYNSRYNAAAARFINSPNCFALETSYQTPDSKTYWQVSSGVLEWTKFNSSKIISANCINHENQLWLELKKIDTNEKATAWTCLPWGTMVPAERGFGYRVLSEAERCAEPSDTDRADDSKWQQKGATYNNFYFVLVQDADGTRHPGKLIVRLKE